MFVALPTAPLMFAAGMADGLSSTPPVETVVASVFALDMTYTNILVLVAAAMTLELTKKSNSSVAPANS